MSPLRSAAISVTRKELSIVRRDPVSLAQTICVQKRRQPPRHPIEIPVTHHLAQASHRNGVRVGRQSRLQHLLQRAICGKADFEGQFRLVEPVLGMC